MRTKNWIDTQVSAALSSGIKKIVSSHDQADYPAAAPGEFPLQRHHHREVLIVLYGESEFALEGRKITITPGTAVLIDQWEQHSAYYRKQDNDLIHIWIHFLSNDVTAYIDYLTRNDTASEPQLQLYRRFSLPRAMSASLTGRWDKLSKLPHDAMREDAGIYMKTIIQFVMEEIRLNYILPEPEKTETDNQKKISFAIYYIDTHNGRDCSLDRLAAISSCSKYHLVHLFKEFTGKTPGYFINEARYRYTQAALKHGLRQKEIADNLGFASPAAFGNWKKKFMKHLLLFEPESFDRIEP